MLNIIDSCFKDCFSFLEELSAPTRLNLPPEPSIKERIEKRNLPPFLDQILQLDNAKSKAMCFSPANLKQTLQEIETNGTEWASFHLISNAKHYGVRLGVHDEYYELIAPMLSHCTCPLKYIDISNSLITKNQIVKLLDGVKCNPYSQLKCIYIGYSEWTIKDVKEFDEYIQQNQPEVLVLGLNNLLIIGAQELRSLELPDCEFLEESKKFDNYYSSKFDDVNLKYGPDKKHECCFWYDNSRMSWESMAH